MIFTNILVAILITWSTNTYHPPQHAVGQNYSVTNGYETAWVNGPADGFGHDQRQNPNVVITDIHEIKTLNIEFNGISTNIVVDDKIISRDTLFKVISIEWKPNPNGFYKIDGGIFTRPRLEYLDK